mgnify:FL=1
MNPITEQLIQKSNGLLSIKPEINDWTGKSFSMFNTGSVEVETAEVLYGLTRLIKPKKILDTGSHFGVSALYMALACQHNDLGRVLSVEHDGFYAEKAVELWRTCGVSSNVSLYNGSSLELDTKDTYELMLLDTEPQIRFAELVKFYNQLAPGGFVFIHDLHRHMSQEDNKEHGFGHPFGKLPQEIIDWVRSVELAPWHFPTPRGFVGFYKTDQRDYKWL